MQKDLRVVAQLCSKNDHGEFEHKYGKNLYIVNDVSKIEILSIYRNSIATKLWKLGMVQMLSQKKDYISNTV